MIASKLESVEARLALLHRDVTAEDIAKVKALTPRDCWEAMGFESYVGFDRTNSGHVAGQAMRAPIEATA